MDVVARTAVIHYSDLINCHLLRHERRRVERSNILTWQSQKQKEEKDEMKKYNDDDDDEKKKKKKKKEEEEEKELPLSD